MNENSCILLWMIIWRQLDELNWCIFGKCFSVNSNVKRYLFSRCVIGNVKHSVHCLLSICILQGCKVLTGRGISLINHEREFMHLDMDDHLEIIRSFELIYFQWLSINSSVKRYLFSRCVIANVKHSVHCLLSIYILQGCKVLTERGISLINLLSLRLLQWTRIHAPCYGWSFRDNSIIRIDIFSVSNCPLIQMWRGISSVVVWLRM